MFAAELVPAITHDGGVLGKGQLIWTCIDDGAKERPHSVTAFVDDLGLIWLDPRSLMREGSVGNYGIEVNAVQPRCEGCSLGPRSPELAIRPPALSAAKHRTVRGEEEQNPWGGVTVASDAKRRS
jgi:hypothetical protein